MTLNSFYNQTTFGYLLNNGAFTAYCPLMHFKQGKFYGQASRPISTGKLHVLPHFHTQPINLVVFQGSSAPEGEGYLILGLVSRLYAFSVYHIRI